MKKIVLLWKGDAFADEVRRSAPGCEVVSAPTEQEAAAHLGDAEILLGWRGFAAEHCLREGGSLRFVQTWSAGVDTLPLARFRELGIALANASGVHPNPISEHVFAMILSFARGIHTAVRHQQSSHWGYAREESACMHEAHGKTLGILGAGAIGAEAAHLGRAFGMTVLGLRRSGEPLPDYDRMYGTDRLEEFLGLCDYVVNLLPLTPETRYMMNAAAFSAMKPGSYYISAGRGPTTSTPDLLEALQSGRLAGAGLDVTDPEPLPEDSPLWKLPNVIITPHNAGTTPDYDRRLLQIFLENLRAYLETGKPCRNVVDLTLSY